MAAILLVHGAWHTPSCWDGFVGRLTEAGHEVRTAQLRGHDPDAKPDARLPHRIRDYVTDLHTEVEKYDKPPVLVGHSMGGLVVQKYLERHNAPAAVLMAPVPPGGVTMATMRFAWRHPFAFARANLTARLGPIVGTPKLAREMLF